jgi:hypothetical protein
MTARIDISDKLIHFTRGESDTDAFNRLRQIVSEGVLRGNGAKIRGEHSCVCFSEAPLSALGNGLLNHRAFSPYSCFGIVIEKKWLYSKGGRPVIYQSGEEYEELPESLRWRHVRYEPGEYDFTWEREWRIHCQELPFHSGIAGLIVPSMEWTRQLEGEHESEQDLQQLMYSQIMDEELAMQYRDEFPWRICVLN